MPSVDIYSPPSELLLGEKKNDHVPSADQDRQRREVGAILERLRTQPGVILADEVGMGKTFVALAAAYSVASQRRRGPVILMVPPNLVDKWIQDLATFCELYLDDRQPLDRDKASSQDLRSRKTVRYGVARHSVELLKLLDDPPRERCHLVFLAQGAMSRGQADKWVRLALIREAFRRHGRRDKLREVKTQIHRFIAELLMAVGEQKANALGEDLWQKLLGSDPTTWKARYNSTVAREDRRLTDDPVPESIAKALHALDLRKLADALEWMPLRESKHLSSRLTEVRRALRDVEQGLWSRLLAVARWRSPLLVMDEAHHLKNPGTQLARQLQSFDTDADLRTGESGLANTFDRMLFLTATPFQLGHQELVRVLERFGDVRWDSKALGTQTDFERSMEDLENSLTESQRTAIALQRCWTRLLPEDGPADQDPDHWWRGLCERNQSDLTPRQRALRDAFTQAQHWRRTAESQLRPWIIRHNKEEHWPATEIQRRRRFEGAACNGDGNTNCGLAVPHNQLLPFFLAARSAVRPGQDLLGDALCSSYEAFRYTRGSRASDRDTGDDEDGAPASTDSSNSEWYLREFDHALQRYSGQIHPKVAATVKLTVDLWERGEKVLVFGFYRHTCRALRLHISNEISGRLVSHGLNRLEAAGQPATEAELDERLEWIQRNYFDTKDATGRRAVDRQLRSILECYATGPDPHHVALKQNELLLDVMRRFLRVRTTLIRCFPLAHTDETDADTAVTAMLDSADGSGVTWRQKYHVFIDFLVNRCSAQERNDYLDAAGRITTGDIRISTPDGMDEDGDDATQVLANVQRATGETPRDRRSRLMRSFNTPFFPDILVCSQVMGEGVDLHRFCRHVIHHDLAWNPSAIEQRTGRIDRLGCKAERRNPIHVYLPYLDGTADERQYRVMTDREQWFRIVMGQDEVAKLIPPDEEQQTPQLPQAFSEGLTFHLGLLQSHDR